jgi:hypothetical protein
MKIDLLDLQNIKLQKATMVLIRKKYNAVKAALLLDQKESIGFILHLDYGIGSVSSTIS